MAPALSAVAESLRTDAERALTHGQSLIRAIRPPACFHRREPTESAALRDCKCCNYPVSILIIGRQASAAAGFT